MTPLLLQITIADKAYRVDTDSPLELAILATFDDAQPRAFGLPKAHSEAVEAGDFVGDRRRGGAVNCESIELTPHGNGTHTECVGHITEERIAVGDAFAEPLAPAVVLSVSPRRFAAVDESYGGVFEPDDKVITASDLRASLDAVDLPTDFATCVVIRVDRHRREFTPRADHTGTNPPYPTAEAIEWLRRIDCEHLLVELPSIDREDDGGTVPNHHLFFGVEPGETPSKKSRRRTVTEMIEVDESIDDGAYALSLRFPRFDLDAAPSRPVLYPLEASSHR